jgi:hypothetical protein
MAAVIRGGRRSPRFETDLCGDRGGDARLPFSIRQARSRNELRTKRAKKNSKRSSTLWKSLDSRNARRSRPHDMSYLRGRANPISAALSAAQTTTIVDGRYGTPSITSGKENNVSCHDKVPSAGSVDRNPLWSRESNAAPNFNAYVNDNGLPRKGLKCPAAALFSTSLCRRWRRNTGR